MTTASLENNQLSNIILPIFKSELTNGIELRILGTFDEPWFIAKDIALMLDYKKPEKENNKDKIKQRKNEKNVSKKPFI